MAILRLTPNVPRGMKRLAFCLIAGFFLLAPATLSAQEHSCLRRSFLVSAVDREGKTIAGLTPENFKGKFRGKPVRVASVRDRNVIPRIVVLLDSSGSMSQGASPKWKLALALASHPTMAFGERAEIALIVFSDQINYEVGFGEPRQAFTDAIASMQVLEANKAMGHGQTALYAAILRAAELLRPAHPGDLIYVVSDGQENASKADFGDVEQTLLASSTRLFAAIPVAPLGPRGRTPEEEAGPVDLQTLARETGGNTISISHGYDLTGWRGRETTSMVDWLYRRMWELTEIEIELPREVDKPRTWELELVPTTDVSAKGATLTYPTKLVSCHP